jgi:hypothetical protein
MSCMPKHGIKPQSANTKHTAAAPAGVQPVLEHIVSVGAGVAAGTGQVLLLQKKQAAQDAQGVSLPCKDNSA